MTNPNLAHCILGVDPGISGALALYDMRTHSVTTYDIPTVASQRLKGQAKDIDGYALGMLIDTLKPLIKKCLIEQVGGIGKQSASKSFQFGLNTGIVHGMIYSNLIPIEFVTPQRWKAHFNLRRAPTMSDSAFKSMSRAKASALMPQHASHWALAKHDGRAEAALIALYGAQQTLFGGKE